MELGRGEPNYFLLGSLRFSHRCHWQYGYWCKQNNWETGTRVPLIISAPWLPASHGRVERSLVESTDLLPTLVEVAGLPPALPTAGGPPIDGSSMARFLAPGGESAGWKDAAFSQFPRCHNRTKFRPIDVFCVGVESVDFEFMGLAIRVDGWRQIEWYEWCATAPCWDRLNATELYEQSEEGDRQFELLDPRNRAGEQGAVGEVQAKLHGRILQAFKSRDYPKPPRWVRPEE